MEQKLLRPECGSKKNLANEIVTQGLVENDRPFTKGLAFMQLDSCDTNKWIVKKMKVSVLTWKITLIFENIGRGIIRKAITRPS